MKKLIIAAVLSLTATSASAALQISCANKAKTVSWSYLIKGGQSARLGSDITYKNGATTTTISFLNVAQFAATSLALYILTDDANENVTYRFFADYPTARPFDAKLEVASPKATYTLTCSATKI